MAHWQNRSEPTWRDFQFNQPYSKGLKRLKEEVLAKTDFDPATLWQWGTMQAMAIIEVLKSCERVFGKEGQKVVHEALQRIGLDIGRQILAGTRKPEEMSEAEFLSFYATVINRIVYASLEDPKIEGGDKISFDILWCPHQDHYQAFDCRVQRYFVQGMLDALEEFGEKHGFQVRFDSTIPAGAPTCHFTLWRGDEEGQEEWARYTQFLDEKALRIAADAKEANEAPGDSARRAPTGSESRSVHN
ncbi:MAG: hypothetical protein U1D30_18520 [Planctomycetota bacterium]